MALSPESLRNAVLGAEQFVRDRRGRWSVTCDSISVLAQPQVATDGLPKLAMGIQ